MFNVEAPIISLSALIEGVVTGLTIAIVLGVCAWIKLLVDRRKQVNHLRHLISLGYERIVRESGFHHQEKVIPADILQYHLLRNIMRDVDDALKYRSNSLDSRKVHEVKMILIEIDCLISALDFGTGGYQRTPHKEFYETHFFGKFRELKWLRLSQSSIVPR